MEQFYTLLGMEFPGILNEMLNCNIQWQPLNPNETHPYNIGIGNHTITLEGKPTTEDKP